MKLPIVEISGTTFVLPKISSVSHVFRDVEQPRSPGMQAEVSWNLLIIFDGLEKKYSFGREEHAENFRMAVVGALNNYHGKEKPELLVENDSPPKPIERT